ncbi:hypothetical protein [Hyphomicrobium sp.]|jgi:hypothetical protein|uniref:hypothetical protein n=1 Tax=Hyphomicrobium sp. TaxID=82 RepID=UPI003566311B
MRLSPFLIAALFFASPVVALAHDEANGPNGGQVTEVAGHHVEFTTKDKEIVLYLTDGSGKPIESKGASGRVIIQNGAKQLTADLSPTDPNQLSAKLDAPLAAGAKVVVSAKLGDGHGLQARFIAK